MKCNGKCKLVDARTDERYLLQLRAKLFKSRRNRKRKVRRVFLLMENVRPDGISGGGYNFGGTRYEKKSGQGKPGEATKVDGTSLVSHERVPILLAIALLCVGRHVRTNSSSSCRRPFYLCPSFFPFERNS